MQLYLRNEYKIRSLLKSMMPEVNRDNSPVINIY